MKRVLVCTEDFNAGVELEALATLGSGGIASFVGHVRGDGGLKSMTLEHYPAMTGATLDRLADEAMSRWMLDGVALIHRIGRLEPGDRIVLVATASRHRASALEACAYLIDRLKTDAPFWKKEEFTDGRTKWVDACAADDLASEKWD